MSLPWVRLDSNIATHDKVLRLLAKKDGHRAFTLYICALGWSGANGRDGHIPPYVLPHLHGTERHARMLVDVGMWEPADDGWVIRNWATRQELAVITEARRSAQRIAARRTNCRRYHGPDCECWKADDDAEATVLPLTKRLGGTERSTDR